MIEFWHNPRCSKSREALKRLEARGAEVTVRRYLEEAPTAEDLHALQVRLGLPAVEMMRVKEARFRELGLTKADDDAALLAAMAENPVLIERPVVIDGARAVIGRPPERVLDLL